MGYFHHIYCMRVCVCECVGHIYVSLCDDDDDYMVNKLGCRREEERERERERTQILRRRAYKYTLTYTRMHAEEK